MSEYLQGVINNYGPRRTPRKVIRPPSPDEVDVPILSDEDQAIIKVTYSKRGQPDEIIEVPPFPDDPYILFNKSAIFYGASGTGKTTLIRHFMYNMKEMFPYVMAFAPTNFEKRDFEKHLPKQLIYEEFSIDDIRNVYQRQKAAASIASKTKDKDILRDLFIKCRDIKALGREREFYVLRKNAIAKAKSKYANDTVKANKIIEKINESMEMECINLYKTTICNNSEILEQLDLSEDEQIIVKFARFNPNTLVLFDDATTELEEMIKAGKPSKKNAGVKAGEDSVIQNFFFKGRWSNITHWYAAHDDKAIPNSLRKNAFASFFTEKQSALSWFNTETNGIGKLDSKRAEAVINAIFDESRPDAKYIKLIYLRLEKKFYYIIADEHLDFQMCSSTVREYCSRIHGESRQADDKYTGRFKEIAANR